ncbi:Fructosamine/Ketosamine-3-kinase [Cordyceps fumosorosea ARSEF 2679]|uniref:protein-ribulosamine 3-kinase n=1 Tax=Cordyceps fumosorosea (strain ARSEF 2679) TaxID=1081104 RepID=A0A162K4H8_CORFA|nr:Fructosamine/Ketosamine-3-kinase [Cordyceps fumosorosea ARSEF 2679]OAA53218.1 Fructosamine/Ketosamine-3-kinase [Cordyceps fumosorosea ARSEF 2679]
MRATATPPGTIDLVKVMAVPRAVTARAKLLLGATSNTLIFLGVDAADFKEIARLVLDRVEDSRVLKPSLVHGDCWDGNTGMDARTGAAFACDPSAFYGHAEYDVGDWRALRHELSRAEYMASYKKLMELSEPKEDWEARNLLYSLAF